MAQTFLDAKTAIHNHKPSAKANLQPTDAPGDEGDKHNRALFRIHAAESALLAMNMLRAAGIKATEFDASLVKLELVRAMNLSPFRNDIGDTSAAAAAYEKALEVAFPSPEQSFPSRTSLGLFANRGDIQRQYDANQVRSAPTERPR